MRILHIDKNDKKISFQAIALVNQILTCSEDPKEEMQMILNDERICLVAVEGEKLLGFVGAIPQYPYAWELHPLVVDEAWRKKGVGQALLSELEIELAAKGVLTIYLGTDDEEFKTSLSEGDLFDDTFNKIINIKNKARHPYEFYQKCGYKIVGVIPDANGIGKPDIWMAKRISLQ